jgi:hypothetical protein
MGSFPDGTPEYSCASGLQASCATARAFDAAKIPNIHCPAEQRNNETKSAESASRKIVVLIGRCSHYLISPRLSPDRDHQQGSLSAHVVFPAYFGRYSSQRVSPVAWSPVNTPKRYHWSPAPFENLDCLLGGFSVSYHVVDPG